MKNQLIGFIVDLIIMVIISLMCVLIILKKRKIKQCERCPYFKICGK